ncbi:MAG: hypothetical protein ACK55I_25535, partial [bacterium]
KHRLSSGHAARARSLLRNRSQIDHHAIGLVVVIVQLIAADTREHHARTPRTCRVVEVAPARACIVRVPRPEHMEVKVRQPPVAGKEHLLRRHKLLVVRPLARPRREQ